MKSRRHTNAGVCLLLIAAMVSVRIAEADDEAMPLHRQIDELIGKRLVELKVVPTTVSSDATKPNELHLIAIGEAAIPALHAAAIAPDSFRTVTLRQMLRSWEDLAAATESRNQAVNVVHGALRHYDLPDLIEMAGASKVKVEPANPLGASPGSNSLNRG